MLRQARILAVLALVAASCGREQPAPQAIPPYGGGGYGYGAAAFKDEVASNAAVEQSKLPLSFVDSDGKAVDLEKFRGKKNVVLVVTRGYPGYVCAMCSAQTSRLIRNYPDFASRDAEVLVVFPGPADHVKDFVQRARTDAGDAELPFKVLLDRDFKAVDQFGIRGDLAKPATYILDKEGKVRFAYVGSSVADRPSVKALLKQLDAINQK
jgi:peroxiredoxin